MFEEIIFVSCEKNLRRVLVRFERGDERMREDLQGDGIVEKQRKSKDWNLSRHRKCETLTTHHV